MQKLRDEGVIIDGIFKSPLPKKQTILEPFPVDALAGIKSDDSPSDASTKFKIGGLLQQIRSGSQAEAQNAFLQLSNNLFSTLGLSEVNTKEIKEEIRVDGFNKSMSKWIEAIEGAKPGDVTTSKTALQNITGCFFLLAKDKQTINKTKLKALFKSGVICGAELMECLAKLEQESEPYLVYKLQTQILNLSAKLEGMILSKNNDDNILANSILTELADAKELKFARSVAGEHKLSDSQIELLSLALRTTKLIFDEDFKKFWQDLCLKAAMENNEDFFKLLIAVQKNKITGLWLYNIVFDKYKASKSTNLDNILQNIFYESKEVLEQLKDIHLDDVRQKIEFWRTRINLWSEPNNFDILYAQFDTEINELIKQLDIDDKMSPVTRDAVLNQVVDLTEMIDQSIKAITGSSAYTDDLKLVSFKKMLVPYHDLMQKWVAKHRYSLADKIKKDFKKCSESNDIAELKPSDTSVSSVIVGSAASARRQYGKVTLETLFSLMHQNIIASVGKLNDYRVEILPKKMQDCLPFFELDSSVDGGYSIKSTLLSINCIHPSYQCRYNIPLYNHSAGFEVEYNVNTNKLILNFHVFGLDTKNRLQIIALRLQSQLNVIPCVQLIKPTLKNGDSEVSYAIEFDLSTYGQNIDEILKKITRINETACMRTFTHTNAGEQDPIGAVYIKNMLPKNFNACNDECKATYFAYAIKYELISLQEFILNSEDFTSNVIKIFCDKNSSLFFTNLLDRTNFTPDCIFQKHLLKKVFSSKDEILVQKLIPVMQSYLDSFAKKKDLLAFIYSNVPEYQSSTLFKALHENNNFPENLFRDPEVFLLLIETQQQEKINFILIEITDDDPILKSPQVLQAAFNNDNLAIINRIFQSKNITKDMLADPLCLLYAIKYKDFELLSSISDSNVDLNLLAQELEETKSSEIHHLLSSVSEENINIVMWLIEKKIFAKELLDYALYGKDNGRNKEIYDLVVQYASAKNISVDMLGTISKNKNVHCLQKFLEIPNVDGANLLKDNLFFDLLESNSEDRISIILNSSFYTQQAAEEQLACLLSNSKELSHFEEPKISILLQIFSKYNSINVIKNVFLNFMNEKLMDTEYFMQVLKQLGQKDLNEDERKYFSQFKEGILLAIKEYINEKEKKEVDAALVYLFNSRDEIKEFFGDEGLDQLSNLISKGPATKLGKKFPW